MAVDFDFLKLPISTEDSLSILGKFSISAEIKNITDLARSRIGHTIYKRGANHRKWPEVLDCSSLIKWVYGEMGIWIPRHSIDQRDFCQRIDALDRARVGDLIFCDGRRNYYWDNPVDGVGHVGIVVDHQMVVHAANSKVGVIETPLEKFSSPGEFRGLGRLVINFEKLYTLNLPEDPLVETSNAIRWKILQNL